MIEGDRANYDSYDYNDYDLYAYDEEEDEKLKEEYKLKQELSEIMDKLNMTTTESPLPNAVRFSIYNDSHHLKFKKSLKIKRIFQN